MCMLLIFKKCSKYYDKKQKCRDEYFCWSNKTCEIKKRESEGI